MLQDIPNQRSEEEGLKLVLAEAWSCLASYLNIPGMPPSISLALLQICMYPQDASSLRMQMRVAPL